MSLSLCVRMLPVPMTVYQFLELIITGRIINMEEACRIGLTNEVVPRGTALNRAVALTQFISPLP
ncbi:hypothetical protein Misp06_02621 [Microbulbifer sp. NBRC 101763]|uniref:hypothetical protein n=1 Tax=Microbulbifer sp. MLAF003 TaxID=3032582 RepID=UPI0024ACFE9F|nr:hypothetical protein [Microbulbifer sp. MLAF003]WHI53384.1 hypothetical protein P3339_11735 [Microbulbifer sp. MLAF003]